MCKQYAYKRPDKNANSGAAAIVVLFAYVTWGIKGNPGRLIHVDTLRYPLYPTPTWSERYGSSSPECKFNKKERIEMSDSSSDFRIAMIAAQWHGDLVNVATDSCYSELAKLGVKVEENVKLFKLPGSLEIPFVSKLLAQSGDWDAVIAFGLVVDGGIYRHEFVAQAVLDGLMSVGLETGVPMLSAVLTPQKFDEESATDKEFFGKHLVMKGAEAARAAVRTLEVVRPLAKSKS
jgi:6,7-dimethyl-8-ribityllumazine synthase